MTNRDDYPYLHQSTLVKTIAGTYFNYERRVTISRDKNYEHIHSKHKSLRIPFEDGVFSSSDNCSRSDASTPFELCSLPPDFASTSSSASTFAWLGVEFSPRLDFL